MADNTSWFALAPVPEEEIHLMAKMESCAPSREETVPADRLKDGAEVRLELRRRSVLAGKVTDEEGKPIAGACIAVSSSLPDRRELGSTETDGKGYYRLEGIPAVPLLAVASASGYVTGWLDPVAVGRDDADFHLKPAGSAAKALRSGKQSGIRGRVVDWKTGEPLKDFTVQTSCGHPVIKSSLVPGS